jgi:hypothetical protein
MSCLVGDLLRDRYVCVCDRRLFKLEIRNQCCRLGVGVYVNQQRRRGERSATARRETRRIPVFASGRARQASEWPCVTYVGVIADKAYGPSIGSWLD